MQTGSHCLKSVNNQLIILLDGNFQHQNQKAAGRNYAALVTPDIFIQPSNLDEMKEYILLQEALHKVPNKVCNASLFIYGWLYADASTASILIKRDKCTESHKAANDSRSDTTWKGCDDTGLMGSCCPVFHAYAHEWGCQVKYNPRYQTGWGLSDGESLERLWLALTPQFDQALIRCNNELVVIRGLVEQLNPNAESNYTVDFFRLQWADQKQIGLIEEDEEVTAKKKKLAKFLTDEEVLRSYRERVLCKEWPESIFEINEILGVINDKEASQKLVAESLGERHEDLRGAGKTELGLLVLLWKAKTDLFALAVDVRAKREPLMTAQAGNILGTRLKEKILAAIKRQKAPVGKAIKLFNTRQKAYFQKADPRQLQLPKNRDLTFNKFLRIDLDDPLWSDVLLLDRVEEEIELLTQELDRSITWACQHWDVIIQAISDLREASTQEPIDLNNRFASILPSFPMKGRLRLLQSELARHLANHKRLMLIRKIKDDLTSSGVSDIDDALERLDFAKDEPDPPDDDERAEDHNWITDEESTPGRDDEVAACAELE
ncbi:hypothetical protein PCASD_01979 [Puccinia coronata f. sp. avenae]|uniref:CxC1-like cysteine cluster associated with KDZ transposases domain-containing protein n=1 Tax=Puccinia coronata f. sp. avenae TaxID=200324 RepID=A0A2N5VHF5_9BASI|nr:hypothetical protein PCASD_01979 [Puccinia coronata f. sp. avenae]